MNKVSFDNIKNIEFPESWIENALNVPSQHQKKPVLLLRYRNVIGLAACAVLAVLVCLPFLFGMNKDVNLTSPSSDEYTGSKQIAVDSTDGTMPSGSATDAVNQEFPSSVTSVTEPAESAVADSDNPSKKSQSSSPKNPGAKSQTAGKSKSSDENDTNSGSSDEKTGGKSKPDTAPTAEKVTENSPDEKPTEPEVEVLTPANDIFAPAAGAEEDSSGVSEENIYSFHTKVDSYYAAGNVFCLIEKENGDALGDGGLFSSKRTALRETAGNKTILKFYCSCNFVKGRTYTVNFYNSHGEMIKKSKVTINNSFDYEI